MSPTELKSLRRSIGFTQREFAEMINYSKQSVSGMEQGRIKIQPAAEKEIRRAVKFALACI